MRSRKGFTSIELLVSFVIVSAITISLFSVVLNYRNKQQITSYETTIDAYINEMTKLVQDDLIKKHVFIVEKRENNTIFFGFTQAGTGSASAIFQVSKDTNSLRYGPTDATVTYPVPNIPDLKIESFHFEQDDYFFSIEVVFSHPNFNANKKLRIVSPYGY